MKIKTLLLCLLCTVSLHAKGPKTYGELTVSELVKVIDGDTIKVNIAGVHPLLGERISVRIARIDTPEMSSTDPRIKALALQAKAFTEEALKNSREVVLTNLRRGKYFRILSDVLIDGEDLADKLLEKGLAVPYQGCKKPDWGSL